jgi:preprotein translocase subunit YajC
MTTKTAAALQIGDMIATIDGKLRKVTGIDRTPAAVRIRTGRSQHWMRAKADAIFTVAA